MIHQKIFRPLALLSVVAASLLLPSGFAADKPAPAPVPTKAAYPLTTCVVSGEKLGSMGKPIEYVHRENGKPDRLVLLCCKTCVDDFQENPAKYLAKIDSATVPATKN
jgi:hypothetical protein